MKKVLIILLAVILSFLNLTTTRVFAVNNIVNKEMVSGGWDNDDIILEAIININVDKMIPKMKFFDNKYKEVSGVISYPNYSDMKEGLFDLQWLFTPDLNIYETKSGIIHFKLYKWRDDVKETVSIIEDEIPTTSSLTATTILLDNKTSYDINLNDKVSGSTYLWTTTDTEIIEVNSKNGKIKAKKEGKAKVTCEIALPDGSKNILESLITIGYDENAPLLTETTLDLEVGDKFDINLENKIQKSTYRWASSNRDIIKVNSSNGKVTANGIGEAYVTCTITTPKTNQVIVLRCDINVTK